MFKKYILVFTPENEGDKEKIDGLEISGKLLSFEKSFTALLTTISTNHKINYQIPEITTIPLPFNHQMDISKAIKRRTEFCDIRVAIFQERIDRQSELWVKDHPQSYIIEIEITDSAIIWTKSDNGFSCKVECSLDDLIDVLRDIFLDIVSLRTLRNISIFKDLFSNKELNLSTSIIQGKNKIKFLQEVYPNLLSAEQTNSHYVSFASILQPKDKFNFYELKKIWYSYFIHNYGPYMKTKIHPISNVSELLKFIPIKYLKQTSQSKLLHHLKKCSYGDYYLLLRIKSSITDRTPKDELRLNPIFENNPTIGKLAVLPIEHDNWINNSRHMLDSIAFQYNIGKP